MTKLFRLPRMLRMIKLLNINTVKRLLKSFQGEVSNANQIVRQYHNLFIYKMIRLVLMLSLCTFFLGCIWFFISSQMQEDGDDEKTWYIYFKLKDKTIYF